MHFMTVESQSVDEILEGASFLLTNTDDEHNNKGSSWTVNNDPTIGW